ncbi:recombination regulator RecX [Streptomyces sp. CA-294286]|uniref:recombination regulator RecX n=1 Tax=Streptomyces sp. CA-294286 TaxID=3240070 RepID=UPI003D90998D
MTRRTDWPGSTDDAHEGRGGHAVPGGDAGYGGRGAHGGAGETGEPDGPPRLPWSTREPADHGPSAAFRGSGARGTSGEDRASGAPEGFGTPGRSRSGSRGSRSSWASRGSGSSRDSGRDGGRDMDKPAPRGRSQEPQDPAEQARAICLRLLTGTPRTRKQLADALHKRDIPEDVSDEVLSRFEEVGLINDAAFADAWVESRHHSKGLARRALARELRTKGVEPSLIDEAVGQLDSDQEEETARELVARKLRSTRGLDRDKRLRRLAGMLARKGYPEGLALRVVRRALEEEGEDTEGLDPELF